MSDTADFGTPGTNWNDARTEWRGSTAHAIHSIRRAYEEWKRVQLARDETATVLMQYGAYAGATADELTRTTAIVEGAFALVSAELRDENVLRGLAPLVSMPHAQLTQYAVSLSACAESPYGGCLYAQEPRFGENCVFCGLSFR